MRPLLQIAFASAWNRRATLGLAIAAIALSVTMLLGVERSRLAAREAFAQSVSGTDLVVGARTSPVQLMLYAVFRLGEATNNIRWSSAEALATRPGVAWTIPLSLGDSHRGFAVLGTTPGYFEHFRYGYRRPLVVADGRAFSGTVDGVFEAVVGAEVARSLHYAIGQRITLSHGSGGEGLAEHADKPFTVVGILAPTGTPVDRTVHISLQAIEAIHLDWQGGAPIPGLAIAPDLVRKFDLAPKTITAVLVGLQQRGAVFRAQREINEFDGEPLLAVLPGVALDQLWQVVGVVERTLLAVSALVLVVGLAGLVAVVLASLNERRRELAILRSVGAGPRHVAALLVAESVGATLIGTLAALALLAGVSWLAGPWLQGQFGSAPPPGVSGAGEWKLIGLVLGAGLVAGLLPAWQACRLSLSDGLTPRL
ncbi:ABC transporter permease [Rhizobacter sp. SG703]|uniref:ABC transporter permease n=1 Tax=Rhizobacter sp. SG703 TaxID=2587140 RepID=UPI001447C5C8|nr:ABC transporter permease [Rhizobacter sp. SG703]NKI92798.1 putative ABC transport system permease protein [Rhizobacter sp. SG703]